MASPAESCPCPTCGSTMTKKYSAADLYTQLGYYNFLFDANRQAAAIKQKRETRPSPSFFVPGLPHVTRTELPRPDAIWQWLALVPHC